MVNNDSLFSNAEKKANKFNLYCLVVITILSFFAIVLHFIGIFNLERETFVPAMLQLAIYSAIPVFIYLFIYYVKKNKNVLEEKTLNYKGLYFEIFSYSLCEIDIHYYLECYYNCYYNYYNYKYHLNVSFFDNYLFDYYIHSYYQIYFVDNHIHKKYFLGN